MSGDRQVLHALALQTKKEIRYFEIVQLLYGETGAIRKCFMCIAQDSIVFMRQDLSQKIHKAGELQYKRITKVVLDTGNTARMVLVLGDVDGWSATTADLWGGNEILVTSESREMLFQHLRVCWQTDHMVRMHKFANFPYTKYALEKPSKRDPPVKPFRGYDWEIYKGYKFMKPDRFTNLPNKIQAEHSGKYKDSKGAGVCLVVEVHEPMTMEALAQVHRDKIAWVAGEYKEHFVDDGSRFYILRNSPRMKRMNFVNDPAAWSCWELVIMKAGEVLLCIVLRRQYIPPLCDCAQDIAITMRCETTAWEKDMYHLMLEASLIADSLSPSAIPSPYPSIIQAKLDALRFSDEGLEWVGKHLNLASRWRREAKKFLRYILKTFQMQSLLENTNGRPPLIQSMRDEEWEELKPIDTGDLKGWLEKIKKNVMGLEVSRHDPKDKKALNEAKNRFMARLARYFAWAVDGGLLGPQFTLDRFFEQLARADGLEEEAFEEMEVAQAFMLHLRSVEPNVDWKYTKVSYSTVVDAVETCEFNDRVMQQWLQQKTGTGKSKEAEEYNAVLAGLLRCKAGVELKAHICRLFIEGKTGQGKQGADQEYMAAAVPSLMGLVRHAGFEHTTRASISLATYASAALMNMSCQNESIKTKLLKSGIADAAVRNMKTKDDDLIIYTLGLLVNLTKTPDQLQVMASNGVVPQVYDLLTSSYDQCNVGSSKQNESLSTAMFSSHKKEKILEHVCSIIGHFCVEEDHRDHLVDKFVHTVNCCCYIAAHCVPGGMLMTKVLFCLKQLCISRNHQKQLIGKQILRHLCRTCLIEEEFKKARPEFLNHLILLLQALVESKENCLILNQEQITEKLTLMERVVDQKTQKLLKDFKKNRDEILMTVHDSVRMHEG